MGANANAQASPAYENDDGDPNHYYGRGYVQLTWWLHYAKAGVALGQGLRLLLEPDRVNEPDTAYQILATGMCTGDIYANETLVLRVLSGGPHRLRGCPEHGEPRGEARK